MAKVANSKLAGSAFSIKAKLANVFLELSNERFNTGDKSALLDGMKDCATLGVPAPKWLADAFVKAYEQAHDPKYMSWDKIFGRPHGAGTKSTHIAFKRKQWIKIGEVVFLHRLHDRKLSVEEYEAIAEKLGTNPQLVKEAWKFYKEYVKPDPAKTVKKRKQAK